MEPRFSHPSAQSVPVDEHEPHLYPAPPNISAPAADTDASDYLDGSTAGYEGANPGRDQDRSRVDECQGTSYKYTSSGTDHPDSDVIEGF